MAYLNACDKPPLQASLTTTMDHGQSTRMNLLKQQLQSTETLLLAMEGRSLQDRRAVLERLTRVQDTLVRYPQVVEYLHHASELTAVAVLSVIAIDQADLLFGAPDRLNTTESPWKSFVDTLATVESFYASFGGVIGYHALMLRKLAEKELGQQTPTEDASKTYLQPERIDITQSTKQVTDYMYRGLVGIAEIGEIYPIGGAGDRLDLKDEKTGEPLPAAKLQFLGRTLLEGLIRDLQAREYLYFRLFGKQLVTPVALMTSQEKHNRDYIINICEKSHWFGREKSSFLLFDQPMIPMVNQEGDWCATAPLQLMLKPGGHGVMWKLARDAGVFDWMRQQGRRSLIVRQINNPISGLDHGLILLAGAGIEQGKLFGFASCPRAINAAEGMNVVVEQRLPEGSYSYSLTNIEYTDFAAKGIQDIPAEAGSGYSMFPANTNILFADIDTVDVLSEIYPVPGLLVNMKTMVSCLDRRGSIHKVSAARLESTMQNIADYIQAVFPSRLQPEEQQQIPSFLTFNERRKTISVTKRSIQSGQSFMETPESCFHDYLMNMHDLLTRYCGMTLPQISEQQDYIINGPSFLVNIHPAMGPLYQVIAQKVRGGVLAQGSELVLEITEAQLENVDIEGSLLVIATNPLGSSDENGVIHYGQHCGKCILRDVQIRNRGVDRAAPNRFWKQEIKRNEALEILLHGNAQFFAERVTFAGKRRIEVPDGIRMTAYEEDGQLLFNSEPVVDDAWLWDYHWADGVGVELSGLSARA